MLKKIMTTVLIMAFGFFLIHSAKLEFDIFKKIISKVTLEGFELSKKSKGSRFSFIVQYDKKGSQYEAVIFRLNPGSDSFSKMDKAFEHSVLKFGDREALFIPGTKTGMSTLKIILNNKTGKLSISHRTMGGKPTNLDGYKKIIKTIDLNNLDK